MELLLLQLLSFIKSPLTVSFAAVYKMQQELFVLSIECPSQKRNSSRQRFRYNGWQPKIQIEEKSPIATGGKVSGLLGLLCLCLVFKA